MLFKANLCKIDERIEFRFKIREIGLEIYIVIEPFTQKRAEITERSK